MHNDTEQLFFASCAAWLHCALFDRERTRGVAAESNLRRALRSDDGIDAALINIGESPCLVQSQLPRLWALRQSVVTLRRARRAKHLPGEADV
jgi:hypothetical protein